ETTAAFLEASVEIAPKPLVTEAGDSVGHPRDRSSYGHVCPERGKVDVGRDGERYRAVDATVEVDQAWPAARRLDELEVREAEPAELREKPYGPLGELFVNWRRSRASVDPGVRRVNSLRDLLRARDRLPVFPDPQRQGDKLALEVFLSHRLTNAG